MAGSDLKGKRGEREWATYLSDRGLASRRTQQHCGRAGDSDVVTPRLPDIFWEVKRSKRQLLMKAALTQAIADAKDQIPIVAYRRDRDQWVCILRAEDMVQILKERAAILMASGEQDIGA